MLPVTTSSSGTSFRMQIRLCSHIEKRATLRKGWQPLLLVQIKSRWMGKRGRKGIEFLHNSEVCANNNLIWLPPLHVYSCLSSPARVVINVVIKILATHTRTHTCSQLVQIDHVRFAIISKMMSGCKSWLSFYGRHMFSLSAPNDDKWRRLSHCVQSSCQFSIISQFCTLAAATVGQRSLRFA